MTQNRLRPSSERRQVRVRGTDRRNTFERHLQQKDGNVILIEGHPIELPDGRILTTVRDVTERRRYEDQLRESEGRFRELAESVREAFFVVEPVTGLAQYVNPAYELIFGHSGAHAVSTPFAWMGNIHPEDRLRVQEAEAVGLRSGEFSAVEFRLHRHEGATRWIRARTTPVRDGSGAIARLVKIAEDITELKRTEEQFFGAQKMEAVGRLAGGVAHDFNNILSAILGYAEMLDPTFDPGDERRQDVGEIRIAARRAAGLTRQLLTFSRHQVVELAVLNPNTVILNLDKMLRRLIGEDVNLVLALAPEAGNVRGDTVQLEQVIMNLVVNARDAMPHGGQLTISSINVEYDGEFAESHQAVAPGRYVQLAVSDSGDGMSGETMARIFEPFFTTKEKGRGTGLGLATVYGIVRQSEGFIGVGSVPGQGTTFRVYLPRIDVAVEPVLPPSQAPTSLAGTETILLAEDDPQLRRLCTILLQKMGYQVIESASAEDALEQVRAHPEPIALVITDVIMPGASGPMLVSSLALLQPDVRVLYVSGYTGDAIIRHGVLRPGLNYLQKPFAPMDLAQRVRQVLDSQVQA